ncbi:MAG: MFS transporter [Desulfovibrionaceae bacterium]|nr:MFS transporter [Desulfovibrionaceae bacterium]MBF0512866.1 MFS transporter [Desulfovibrionaceae bacterium]
MPIDRNQTATGETTGGEAAKNLTGQLLGLMQLRRAKAVRNQGTGANCRAAALSANMFGGVAGNVLEWYDFAIFGFLAPLIGENFFPSDDPLVSLLGAFGVFAAAFLARPAGGLLFGYIGDRHGRKYALRLSVMLMAAPTFFVGLLPTHASIGTLAPVLLVLLRLAQGLSVGGELIGSIAFVSENAPPGRRGFYSSWTFASGYTGMMLGSLCAVLMNAALGHRAMAAWGWRLPFLTGVVIALAAIWMRKGLTETPAFEDMRACGRLNENPLADAVRLFPGDVFHAALLVTLVGGGFYILFLWWPTFLDAFAGSGVPYAAALNTFSLIVLIVLIPLAGRLSDQWGRKRLLAWSSAGLALLSWPLFLLATQGGFFPVFAAQMCFTVLMGFYLGPIPAALVEMFPANVRYSAIGLGYNLSLCFFGGTAPLLATWLVRRYQTVSSVALYLVFLSCLNLAAALALRETKFIRVEDALPATP